MLVLCTASCQDHATPTLLLLRHRSAAWARGTILIRASGRDRASVTRKHTRPEDKKSSGPGNSWVIPTVTAATDG